MNNPINMIDPDGRAPMRSNGGSGDPPGGYDPTNDPFLAAELVYTAVATPLEGLYNMAIGINNLWRSDEQEANIIRGLLVNKHEFTWDDVFSISDSDLIDNLEVSMSFFGDKGYYLDSRGGTLEETFEGLMGGLQIASAFAGGGPGSLLAKSPGFSGLSINQLQKLVEKGKITKTIERFDKGKIYGELDHVHFKGGAALNVDGTWKHGFKELTKKEKTLLSNNGWTIE